MRAVFSNMIHERTQTFLKFCTGCNMHMEIATWRIRNLMEKGNIRTRVKFEKIRIVEGEIKYVRFNYTYRIRFNHVIVTLIIYFPFNQYERVFICWR